MAVSTPEIDRKKLWMMWDRKGYLQFLGEVARPLGGQFAARDREAPGRGTATGGWARWTSVRGPSWR
jgi:hypothetical protein